ncbi:stalk domain-containing protein [Paenibacillus beijingensis]|uniref:Copper amine oxidase-like N-terminal domain-containing protein n=1 Tax=Paenibacillus beijingensis TaxID=1126833 RepID=A0A0D5NKS7_9BACL|nr:stalk domain-containing protein [Paenibacillus beijingensis]AJY75720.1 hypothetical protein VN24_15625 [Paenibacillus beijingensis]
MFVRNRRFRSIPDNRLTRGAKAHGIRRIPGIRVVISLMLAVLLASPVTVSAKNVYVNVQTLTAKLVIGGSTLKLENGQHLFIANGRMYVPVRTASYALHKSVSWNGASKTVTIAEATYQQSREIDSYVRSRIIKAGFSADSKGTVRVVKVKSSFIVNGKAKSLPAGQSSYIVNGSLYVPIRFVSDLTGASVSWDGATRIVSIRPPVLGGGGGGDGGSESGLSGGSSAGSPGSANKPSYDSITGAAEQSLNQLRSTCQQKLTALAIQYMSETSESGKQTLAADGKEQMAGCSAEFEKIVANTEQQLVQYGYSTAIIAEYRTEFERELDEGRKILSEL